MKIKYKKIIPFIIALCLSFSISIISFSLTSAELKKNVEYYLYVSGQYYYYWGIYNDTYIFIPSDSLNLMADNGDLYNRNPTSTYFKRMVNLGILWSGIPFDMVSPDDSGVRDFTDYLITREEYENSQNPDTPEINDTDLTEVYKKLEEFGYDIEHIKEVIEKFNLLDSDLSEKLDILIVLYKEQIDYYEHFFHDDDNVFNSFDDLLKVNQDIKDYTREIDYTVNLVKDNIFRNPETFYDDDFITLSEQLDNLSESINDSLTVTAEHTLEDLNKTLLTTNKFLSYLFVLILITLVLLLALFVGSIVRDVIKKNIY